MNRVGQHLGRAAGNTRGISGRTRRPLAHEAASGLNDRLNRLVHGDVRDRDAATWLLASVLTVVWLAAMAWALHAQATSPQAGSAAVLLGGWSLTLLPVHCARRFRRTAVPIRSGGAAAPPDPSHPGAQAPRTHDEGAGRDESPPMPHAPRPAP